MKKTLTLFAVAFIFTLSGCGNTDDTTNSTRSTDSNYPLTIKNVTRTEGGAKWIEKDQVFEKVPERVLANTRPAAELLLHLGLKDKIAGVGAVFGMDDSDVKAEFDELNHLSKDYINKETALSVDPDLIFGRGGLFDNAEWGNGTVDSINEMGIPTYVQETSTQNATFESVYNDIDNLGKIFDVEPAAKSFKEDLKEREQNLKDRVKEVNNEQRFVMLFMTDPSEVSIYPAYGESFFNSMFDMTGLDNVLRDVQGDVSLETLIETDPDVLIVPDWTTTTAGAKKNDMIDAVLSNEKLSSMKAVKNKQVYSVDYNYMFGYGYQSLAGMELLIDEMYGTK